MEEVLRVQEIEEWWLSLEELLEMALTATMAMAVASVLARGSNGMEREEWGWCTLKTERRSLHAHACVGKRGVAVASMHRGATAEESTWKSCSAAKLGEVRCGLGTGERRRAMSFQA